MPSLFVIAVSAWYIAVWVAVAVVFAGTLWMARSDWARRRPMLRCILYSLAAHAVLIAIAAAIRFVSLPPGAARDEPVRVTIVAMAPQSSIKAPDAPAATRQTEPEQPTAEPVPEVVEADPQQQTPTPMAEQTEAEPLAAPELMPAPEPKPAKEPAPVEAPSNVSQQAVTAADTSQAPPPTDTVVKSATETNPQPAPTPTPPQPDVVAAEPAVPQSLADRIRPDRLKSVVEQGGSRETEQAVGLALEWLAYAQSSDGRWDADRWQGGREFVVLGHNRRGAGGQADTAVTGLALLTFLGSGHTHLDGPYQQPIAKGLVFLIRSQGADGNLAGEASFYARTYSHSMATFALAEAYALTGDQRLETAVRRAVDYLLNTENRAFGGWRYKAHDQGDVSQLGWIIMALRSAEIAGVDIPDDTWLRIDRFLARVARGRHGGLAAYQARTDWSRAMTAESMYCRQVLGKPLRDAALGESLGSLSVELPGDDLTNYYYWYYATLALHHAQHDSPAAGYTWRQWNERLKRELLSAQVAEGTNAGSWSPNTVWGGYGGRVYSTAMAAMCLEVYYRYGAASDDGSPWVASRPRGEPALR